MMDVQTQLNKFLHRAGYGGLTRLAKKAGVSKATISLVRNGKYPANAAKLEQKLKLILDEAYTKSRIATGRLRIAWLVNTRDGLRLVRSRSFLRRLRDEYPDMHVVNVWTGEEPKDVYFTEEGQRGGMSEPDEKIEC